MKTKRLIFAGILFLMAVGFLSAQDKSWENDDFSITWTIKDNNLIMTLTAKTKGWVSIGFEPSKMMKDADILIFAVDETGKILFEDHFGTAPTGHKKDTDLGGKDNITILSGSEKDGITTVTFSIPLNSGDSNDKILSAGRKIKVIFASSGKDGFTVKHNKKAKTEITL